MTSGTFRAFPVDSIWVDRAKRQRRELDDIPALADSISRTGLINPIVIKRDGELVAGERRWEAHKLLGYTQINVQFAEEMSEAELQLLELEENIRRVDLPWQDQCAAIAKYHELRKAEKEEWREQDTADALGLSRVEVHHKLDVQKEIDAGNERVLQAPKYSVARGVTQRKNERARASAGLEIAKVVESPTAQEKTVPLINEDFNEWQKSYSGPKFNFLHCDFPYGIRSEHFDQGAASSMGDYDDMQGVYWGLLDTLEKAMENVVADSAHLIFWFSPLFWHDTKTWLEGMGWSLDPFPLVWVKSDNTGILPDPNRGPRRIYETAFFGRRGDRKIVMPVANAFGAPATKRIHPHEKNENMLRHFFRMTVDEYSTVLDPTAGSAGAIRVALAGGAASALGIEKSPEFYNLAKEQFYEEEE